MNLSTVPEVAYVGLGTVRINVDDRWEAKLNAFEAPDSVVVSAYTRHLKTARFSDWQMHRVRCLDVPELGKSGPVGSAGWP